MINFKLLFVSNFFKLFITLFIFQFGNHAAAQNINLPIYTIKSAVLKSLIIKGGRSKLTACILMENEGFNPKNKSTLKLFNFYKNRAGGGSRVYKNEADAELFNKYFDTAFVPFLISNSEIKMQELRNLPDSKDIAGDVFYFVPHLKQMDSAKGSEYYLIFSIKYIPKNKELQLNNDTASFLKALSFIATSNPCPPARPADYKGRN